MDGQKSPIVIHDEMVASFAIPRPNDGHKGTFGRLLVRAGSEGMGGAGYLCTMSALRSGVGLVHVLTAQGLLAPLMTLCPTATSRAVDPDGLPISIEELHAEIKRSTAVLMGPGLVPSCQSNIEQLKEVILTGAHVILDAGALTMLAENDMSASLQERRDRQLPPMVITPHVGEFKRLCPSFDGKVRDDIPLQYAKDHHVILVLKDHQTSIFTPAGAWYSIAGGNNGLAKGGSGDVLAGLLGGFLAQGMEEEKAAISAVYIHSMAGKMAAADYGVRAMLPTMLWDYYPQCYTRIGWEKRETEL
ncbi:MAG TPA: NAD(P)H-hydrate dehydratase [Bacillota bacterium]|mgnify:CR=1 FL=1|nr:NAD(P)H-hydrate dehydratase [Bacillota bacterium]HPE38156.1 NAD(P)H-hydrate dehydratase [Bacillota bacterium]